MDILTFIFFIVIAFFCGAAWKKQQLIETIISFAKDGIEEEEASSMDIIIEEHEGSLFAYREHDKLYLAHSHDAQSLIDTLKLKYPDTPFTADMDSAQLLLKKTR